MMMDSTGTSLACHNYDGDANMLAGSHEIHPMWFTQLASGNHGALTWGEAHADGVVVVVLLLLLLLLLLLQGPMSTI